MLNRRQFIWSSLAVVAAPMVFSRSAFGRRRQFPPVPLVTTKMRQGVFAITERGGNSMLIVTSDGAILIDTKLVTNGSMLADEVKKTAAAGPKVIINTHHHFDHTGGNHLFDDQAQIIAHRNLNPRMAKMLEDEFKPGLATEINALRNAGKEDEARALAQWADGLKVEDFAADQEYDETLELDRGGMRITLQHFGSGHTDNDTIVFLPELNVLATGDLLFHKNHPYIDRGAGANTVGWRDSVRKCIALCDDKTIVVPGHGESTDKNGLATQIEYFDRMQQIVEEAIKAGKSKEAVGKIEPTEFKDYGLAMLREGTMMSMYEELTAGMN